MQKNRGAYPVDIGFVTSVFLLHASIYHGANSQFRCKAFVQNINDDAGKDFFQPVDKWLYILSHGVRFGAVEHRGATHHNALYRFGGDIPFEPFLRFARCNGFQSDCYQLQRVSNGKPGTFAAIINTYDSSHAGYFFAAQRYDFVMN